jgi:hypothetical protein
MNEGTHETVEVRMENLLSTWSINNDPRASFLNCYFLMTKNMQEAIRTGEFQDPLWVTRLLNRFAEYYFDALSAYEMSHPATPRIWKLTYSYTTTPGSNILASLLLGINAHINYDLVFTLVDMLAAKWTQLSEDERQKCYQDHCHVNSVIARTIDAVQETVLVPRMTDMKWIDQLFGRIDEWALSTLITRWRDVVWEQAVTLMDTIDDEARTVLIQDIEEQAVKRNEIIRLMRLPS